GGEAGVVGFVRGQQGGDGEGGDRPAGAGPGSQARSEPVRGGRDRGAAVLRGAADVAAGSGRHHAGPGRLPDRPEPDRARLHRLRLPDAQRHVHRGHSGGDQRLAGGHRADAHGRRPARPGRLRAGPGPGGRANRGHRIPVQPGTAILSATSTRRSVDVQLPVSQEYLVRRADPVTITLPDGTTTTPGVIAAVATVATAAPGGGSGNSPASPGSGNSSSSSSGSGTTGDTVDVTVRLIHPAAAGRYDRAPVEVNIVDASASNVLAVPINALVALAGGGYAVEVVDGPRRTLLAVRTGLFADTRG